LKNQLREMHEGGIDTHALAKATGDMANAASDQTDAAQQFSDTTKEINDGIRGAVEQLEAAANNAKASIRSTQDTLRIDQRAWLGVTRISPPESFAVDKPFVTLVTLTNTGKTPAKDISVTYTIRPGDPNSPDFSVLDPAVSRGVLFPNGESGLRLDATRKTAEKLPQDTYTQIQSGQTILLVYGMVRYTDVFGYTHWAKSCSFFDKNNGNFAQCHGHNEIDQEQR
jgi:hypothetical protein